MTPKIRIGVIKDVDRLKSLYYLFEEVLHHLCQIGSAYENDPQLELERPSKVFNDYRGPTPSPIVSPA